MTDDEHDSALPDALYAELTALSAKGDDLLEDGRPDAAIEVWQQALALLPEPRRQWQASLWLNASIGDAERAKGDVEAALAAFEEAAASGAIEGQSNPFVHLGLGSCLIDLGRDEEATEPLLRAYMMEGEEIFAESDRRYLAHLRAKGLIDAPGLIRRLFRLG